MVWIGRGTQSTCVEGKEIGGIDEDALADAILAGPELLHLVVQLLLPPL
jgi:hypothetical protein